MASFSTFSRHIKMEQEKEFYVQKLMFTLLMPSHLSAPTCFTRIHKKINAEKFNVKNRKGELLMNSENEERILFLAKLYAFVWGPCAGIGKKILFTFEALKNKF